MKRIGIAAAVMAVASTTALVYGQGDRPGQSGKPLNPTGRPAHRDVELGARDFINDMAIAGRAEVQLGKMASEHASNAEVRAFGRMMVTDHSKAGDELKQVASQLNVLLPAELDSKHRDLVDRLSKLQGPAFDREYMDAMVKGHQEVAAKLRTRTGAQSTSAAGHEQALNQWAAKALPTVQQHLQRAQTLQQKVAK